jgi:predicted RNA-binding Zn ribbon-like protein
MVVTTEGLQDLNLIGGRPCLDFVNTEGGERNGPPERIDGYGALVAWSLYAGLVDAEEATRLDAAGRERPAAAGEVADRATALREALYRILSAAAEGEASSEPDLAVLNDELEEALRRRRLAPGGSGHEWRFEAGDRLDLPLWLVAHDAGELLTSDELGRLKECDGDSCTWLFMDESRNRSRRWCDMGECGNRAKVRRFRERHS